MIYKDNKTIKKSHFDKQGSWNYPIITTITLNKEI